MNAEKKTHRVELTTCQGDKNTRDVTEAEARELEALPFTPGSNIAVATVSPRETP